MKVPIDTFTEGMHSWQRKAFIAFDESLARFYMLRWHRRARKTTLALNLLIREAATYPRRNYTYVGPTYKQAKKTVWLDPNMIWAYLPPKAEFNWEKNDGELYIRFQNESLIQILGGDDPDSLRGVDSHGVVFDEWALMKEMIWLEIFRPILAQDPNRWAGFLFTPKGMNHAAEMWNRAVTDDKWYTSLLRASTSEIIPPEELYQAKLDMPQAMYDQEMECEFITEEEMVLITSRILHILSGIGERLHNERKRIISVDPATGGDECVAYAMENTKIIDEIKSYERDTMKIVGNLLLFSAQTGIDNFIVDCIGVGKGIADRLAELGKEVIFFNSAEKAMNPDRFANKRAEVWWYAMEQIRDCLVDYPEDMELRRQLTAVHYKVMNSKGRIIMEKKDDVKKMIGRSPDRADTWVQGIYGTTLVDPDRLQNESIRHRYRKENQTSVMAV